METSGVLASLFDGVSDGVAVAEADGSLLYLNPAARSLLGVAWPRGAGASVCGLLCGRLRKPDGEECASTCALREPGPTQAVAFRGKHGPSISYDWADAKVLRREGYRPLRVRCQRAVIPGIGREGEEKHLVFMEDVSAEAALEREREDWRSMVAHDLRAPLTNVLGTLLILAEVPAGRRALEQKESELACKAADSCRRLLELLNLFLDTARLESGVAAPDKATVALWELVEGCVAEQSPAVAAKSMEVRVDVAEDLAVLADRELLRRVLDNLLGNALKFTQNGGVVEIFARAVSEWETAVTITDNGPGIEEGELAQIFERFQRARVQCRAGTPGTGLGLAFCRKAVRAMRGEITVESAPGRGSAFTVVLPAARGPSGGEKP